ncbi:hypothetical protein FSPOR_10347 [Fusarium sporotrichioides]|uniref:F-box domain-containing protein n=1 Tax=Fusarium sporotrichioides TaxID=5514 RepID=A0A395RLE7_FUSSP|nr:hypothetical protein FSPOR_10347 [Fusarium sporotrichioides]
MFSCQPNLENLPTEIQLSIFSQLPRHNLAQLARTSKHLSDTIIPLIWSDIEFHSVGFHKSSPELNVPPPVRSPDSRKCHPGKGYNSGEMKAEAFFTTLQTLHVENPDRMEHVAKRIKHLCTVVHPQWLPRTRGHTIIYPYPDAIRVWGLLPYMTNLESLEIHGSSLYRGDEAGDPLQQLHGPTPRLRFAKLSGYIPRPVAAWVLKADTLERLELAMLDRPISMYDCPRFAPLPHEKLKKEDDDENSEADSDDESDWGSLRGEAVIPRPLGGFLSSYQDKGPKLPKLTHLYLSQPAESDYETSFHQYTWSTRAEWACHRDWRQILQASLPTLKILVLEQRPAADYLENDGIPEMEWMENRTTPAASRNLLNMVQKVLEADRSQGPLQCVYLYGIFIGELDEEDGLPDPAGPSGRFMQFLRGCGVECEARVGQWCFFDNDDGGAVWDAYYSEDEDDDEDCDRYLKWDDVLCIV